MRNAKKTLSLVMVAIFTTFIVLSGIPAGAVTSAQAKAQVTKATAAVVKVEKTVKVASFNPTTATTQLTAANKEVAKVKSLGTAYKKNYTALAARTSAVAKKITARKAAILAAAKKVYTDAEAAVTAAENATDGDKVDLVGDETALANAQSAVTTALEMIVKLNQDSSDYKGLMARIDAANNLIVKAMDEIAEAAAAKAAEEKAKADAEAAAKVLEAAVKAAETDVAALEAAPVTTLAEIDAAVVLGTKAAATVKAIANAEKEAPFVARIKAVADKGLAAKAAIEAKAAADAAAKLPATILSVSAVDGTITVTFNKKPITTPAAVQFVVTKTVTTTSAVTTTVVPTALAVVSDTAITLAVPAVAAINGADQSVVYSVVYNATGSAVVAGAITIAKIPGLTVESVTATNLKTAVVKFNREVDDTTLTATNVKVYVNDSTTATTVQTTTPAEPSTGEVGYVLAADKKTMTIIFGTTLVQTKNIKVVINGVKDTAGVAMTTAYEVTKAVTDTVVPTITGVTFVNAKKLIVNFSEPANVTKKTVYTSLTQANVGFSMTIDGSTVFAKVTPVFAENQVIVEPFTAITSGSKNVVVGGMADFATFTAASGTFALVVPADSSAPVATLEYVNKTSVKLTFNEEVSAAGVAYGSPVFEIYELGNANNLVGTATYSTTDPKVVTVAVTGAGFSASALTEFTVKYKNVQDVTGNINTAFTTLSGKATDDLVKPTITSSSILSNNKLEIRFSEAVTLTGTTFKLYTATGTSPVATYTVANTAAAASAVTNAYDLTMPYLTGLDSANYRVVVETVTDKSIRTNAMDAATLTFTAKDTKAPTALNVVITQVGTSNDADVAIVFSEAMDATTLANISNYFVGNGSAGVSLSNVTSATATVSSDNKKVTLRIPGGWAALASYWTGKIDKLAAPALKDAAGTAISGPIAVIGTPATISANFGTFTQANITVESTATNKIVVTAGTGHVFTAADAANFRFYAAGAGNVASPTTAQLVDLGVTAAQVAADGTTVTLTTSVNLNTDGTYTGKAQDGTTTITAAKVWMYVVAGDTKNQNAVALAVAPDAPAIAPTDKVAPTTTVAYDSTLGTATITFSEAVKKSAFLPGIDAATTKTALAQALVIKKADGTRLAPTTDYTISVKQSDGTTDADLSAGTAVACKVIITFVSSGMVSTVSELSLGGDYLVDNNANKLAAISSNSGTTVITEKVAPTATVTSGNATALVLTFNEALYVNGTAVANATDIKDQFTIGGTTAGTTAITSATYDSTAKTVTFVLANVDDADTLTAKATLTDGALNVVSTSSDVYTYTSGTTSWAAN